MYKRKKNNYFILTHTTILKIDVWPDIVFTQKLKMIINRESNSENQYINIHQKLNLSLICQGYLLRFKKNHLDHQFCTKKKFK